jgi:hypothetical protein
MYSVRSYIADRSCEGGRECRLGAKVPLHQLFPTWIKVHVFNAFCRTVEETLNASGGEPAAPGPP